MSLNSIDYTKLGYRWKGNYSAGTTYVNYDVTKKDGEVYYYLNGSWVEFAKGQQNATTKGQVVTNSLSGGTSGVKNTYLHSKNGSVEFRYSGERAGTRAVKLMRKKRTNASNQYNATLGAIMSDGTLRTWADNTGGRIGQSNYAISTMHPNSVALPQNVYAVDAFQLEQNIYVIDQDGNLWAMGSNSEIGGWSWNPSYGNGANVVQSRFINISLGTDMEGKKITYIIGDREYNSASAYTAMFAQDENGNIYSWGFNQYGQCGRDGQVNPQRKPTRVATLADGNPMPVIKQKHIFPSAHIYSTTGLIDENGKLYTCGYLNRNLNDAHYYEGFVEYTKILSNTYSVWRTGSSDYHVTAGVQYKTTQNLVDTTGRVWGRGDSTEQGHAFTTHPAWALPTIGGAGQMTSDDGQTIFGGSSAYGGSSSGVDIGGFVDVWGTSAGYERYFGLGANGEIWGVGYSQANGNSGNSKIPDGTGGGWNKLRFRTEDGKDQTAKHIHSGNDVFSKSKLHVAFGLYTANCSSLTTDGYMFAWGENNIGACGTGDVLDINPYSFQSDGIPSMQVNEKIIDYEIAGSITAVDAPLNYCLLDDNGGVWTVGSGVSQLNNDDDAQNIYVPRKVLF